MEDNKVVPLRPAKEKKDDAGVLVGIGLEIEKIEDKATRDNLMDAWRKSAIMLFSGSFSPG